jgi:hypothetical protein
MTSRTPVVFTTDAVRKIKRDHEQNRQRYTNSNGDHHGGAVRRHQSVLPSGGRIRFLNNASETVPRWGIMRVTGASANKYLTTAKPDATYRWLYLVNVDSDVAAGKSGWASYLTAQSFNFEDNYVLYDTGATPAYGEHWGPKSGEWKLFQHRPGFFILGGTTGSGSTARVVAIQLPPGEVRVKNDDGSGSYAAGGTGRTFGIYGGTAGTTDTGLEVTLNNGSTTAWAADKYGWATADAGGAIWGAPHQT